MGLPLPSGDYFAFVSRSQYRPDSEVYAWTIHDCLPSIPIPLLAGTPDVVLDLAAVFATTYERGRYARLIDCASLPSVLRKPEDRAGPKKQCGAAPLGSSPQGRQAFNSDCQQRSRLCARHVLRNVVQVARVGVRGSLWVLTAPVVVGGPTSQADHRFRGNVPTLFLS